MSEQSSETGAPKQNLPEGWEDQPGGFIVSPDGKDVVRVPVGSITNPNREVKNPLPSVEANQMPQPQVKPESVTGPIEPTIPESERAIPLDLKALRAKLAESQEKTVVTPVQRAPEAVPPQAPVEVKQPSFGERVKSFFKR